MFKKLVSNLAYSPALVGQLGFYAKRLKKEETTRRMGLVFTALALVVQSFAVFSPPESANASSSNDFIPGGITTKAQYMSYYDSNYGNMKDLFNVLGISRSDIVNSQQSEINSKGGYYSWGHDPRFSYAQGERPYTVKTSSGGTTTFYSRPLNLWDSRSNLNTGSYYKVFVGKATGKGTISGQTFYLTFNCGNLALKFVPPPPPCPEGYTGTYPNCTPPPKMCTVPGKEKLPANSPDCKPNPVAVCKSLSISLLTNNRYQFTGNASTQYGATVSQYTYTVKRDGKVIETKTIPSTQPTNSYIYTQKDKGTYTVTLSVTTSAGIKTSADCAKSFTIAPPEVCAVNPKLPKASPDCQPCPGDETIWIKDERCKATIVQTKTAVNTTQNGDAVASVAKAGDKITYSLNIENKGLSPATVTINEQLDDVLQYSTVINNGSGSLANDVLSWPAITLKAGEKQTRMFTVQVLDTIPTMPTGASDGSSFDCRMTNTFGNTIDISVNCPAEKQIVEQTVAELPHTGPTENMLFAGALLTMVTYFYARSRQIKKEIRLIRRDFNAGTI